jgi:hypothetical protein
VNKMKQISTVTSVIVAVVVLLAALGVGLCVREIRFKRAGVAPGGGEVQSPIHGPGGRDRKRAPSPEERAELVKERAAMLERSENMSEEEKEKFRTNVRERFSGGRRREGGLQRLSEEDRTKMREEMEKLRANWDKMSEEERQEATAKIREKFGFVGRAGPGGRPGGDRSFGGRRREGGSQRLSDEDRIKMREEMEKLRANWDEMSEEERQEATAKIREQFGFLGRTEQVNRPDVNEQDNE